MKVFFQYTILALRTANNHHISSLHLNNNSKKTNFIELAVALRFKYSMRHII